MQPLLRLESVFKNLKTEWKFAFLSAFSIGLLTHMFAFTNTLLTHDSVYSFYSTQNVIWLGRVFLAFACGISSFYNLPWVIGLLSLLYLSLTTVLLVELFHIKKKVSILLIAGFMVTFPTITCTFAFMFTADGYLLSMLLATLAVFACEKKADLWGVLFGAVFLCGSIGIYQAYLSFAVVLILLLLLSKLLLQERDTKATLISMGRFLGMGILGLLFYLISSRILLWLQHYSLSSYQGISDAGLLSLAGYRDAFLNTLSHLKYYFLVDFPSLTFYNVLNLAMLILLVVSIVWIIIRKKIYKNIPQLLLVLVFSILAPLCAFLLMFTSETIAYHSLMVGSLVLFYVFFAFCLEHSDSFLSEKRKLLSVYQWSSLLLSFLVIFNFFIVANISYQDMEQSYEKSYATVLRVVDRIEQTENFDKEITEIAVIGAPWDPTPNHVDGYAPTMVGVRAGSFLIAPVHYVSMMNWYFGYEFTEVSNEKKAEIICSKEYQNMNVWPKENSTAIIDNTLVINLEEQ